MFWTLDGKHGRGKGAGVTPSAIAWEGAISDRYSRGADYHNLPAPFIYTSVDKDNYHVRLLNNLIIRS